MARLISALILLVFATTATTQTGGSPGNLSKHQTHYMNLHKVREAQEKYGPWIRGAGVSVGDVEAGFNPWHIELRGAGTGSPRVFEVVDDAVPNTDGHGTTNCKRAFSEVYKKRLIAPCESVHAQHGTAVLSIIGGRDDGVGITGLAPDALLFFSSTGLHNRTHTNAHALARLVDALSPGDILLIEMQAPYTSKYDGNGSDGVMAGYEPLFYTEIRRAVAKGLVVVQGAGNAGVWFDAVVDSDFHANLQNYRARPDSGAITVGASNYNGVRRWDHTNYGDLVDVYSLGVRAGAAGHAYVHAWAGRQPAWKQRDIIWPQPKENYLPKLDLTDGIYGSPAPDRSPQSIRADLIDQPWFYTTRFGGTSSASAIVAGLAASIQSYANARHPGRALTSFEVRQLMIESAEFQVDGIGKSPNLLRAIDLLDAGWPNNPKPESKEWWE